MDRKTLIDHIAWLTEQVVALQSRVGVHPEQLPQGFDLLRKGGPAQSSNNGQALTECGAGAREDMGTPLPEKPKTALPLASTGCGAASQSARQGARRRA